MKTDFTKNQDNKLNSLLNSSCCPSLFDENMKDIPKRRNIRNPVKYSTNLTGQEARSGALSEASNGEILKNKIRKVYNFSQEKAE